MFLDKRLNQINTKISLQGKNLSVTTTWLIFSIYICVNAGHCLVLPGSITICFQSLAFLLHERPILNAGDWWRQQGGISSRSQISREFATVISSPPGLLMCQTSISNIQFAETLSSFFGTRFNPFVHLRNRTRNYFPKNDSSAAGVRWTELMFRRIRSLTEDVAFEENDWILISLLKTKNVTQWGKLFRFW